MPPCDHSMEKNPNHDRNARITGKQTDTEVDSPRHLFWSFFEIWTTLLEVPTKAEQQAYWLWYMDIWANVNNDIWFSYVPSRKGLARHFLCVCQVNSHFRKSWAALSKAFLCIRMHANIDRFMGAANTSIRIALFSIPLVEIHTNFFNSIFFSCSSFIL
jgi:hypothetical protein